MDLKARDDDSLYQRIPTSLKLWLIPIDYDSMNVYLPFYNLVEKYKKQDVTLSENLLRLKIGKKLISTGWLDENLFQVWLKPILENFFHLLNENSNSMKILKFKENIIYNNKRNFFSAIDFLVKNYISKLTNFPCTNLLQIYKMKRYSLPGIETAEMAFFRLALLTCEWPEIFNRPEILKFQSELLENWQLLCEGSILFSYPTIKKAFQSNLSPCFLFDASNLEDTIITTLRLAKEDNSGGIGIYVTSLPPEDIIKLTNLLNYYINLEANREKVLAIAIYIDIHHPSCLELLRLKSFSQSENHLHRVTIAINVSDFFMETLSKKERWYFSTDVKLTTLKGKKYKSYLQEIIYQEKSDSSILAQTLYKKIVECQMESGVPYLIFIDAANELNMQGGNITSSNLCSEILLSKNSYPNKDGVAICNIGVLNLTKCVANGKFSIQKLHYLVNVMVRSLNQIIDKNFYILGKDLNLKSRPIGVGICGWHSMCSLLGISYDKSINLANYIAMHIYYAALKTSQLIYDPKYMDGSMNIIDKFHWELFDERIFRLNHKRSLKPWDLPKPMHIKSNILITKEDWDLLRGKRRANSVLIALMPSNGTSSVLNVSPSIEPFQAKSLKHFQSEGSFLIENKFEGKNAWEINPFKINQIAASFQRFTDQSISLNRYQSLENTVNLEHLFIHGWANGLKTFSYYTKQKIHPNSEVEKKNIKLNVAQYTFKM